MIKNKLYLHCKKDFLYGTNIIFHKGERYYYYYDDDGYYAKDEDIFIYYDEESENEYRRGYRMCFKCDSLLNSLVYDYFYTPIEERKMKLEKLNKR